MNLTVKALLLACVFGGVTSVAFAADPYTPPLVQPELTPDVAFYAGLNVGGISAFADHDGSPPNFAGGYDITSTGLMFGGQIGATFHFDDTWVGGIQADLDLSNATGSLVTGGAPGTITQTIDWIATIEGRLGYDFDTWMPYLAGGVAMAQGTREASAGDTDTISHTGLSVGAGAVFVLGERLTLDLEYRYQMFGFETYDTGGIPPSIALNVSSVRAGLNYTF